MVDKITQPITPVEEIEKINEIIDDSEASKVSIENSLDALAAISAKVDLSNLSTVGQEILDSKLNKQMISNCITEIPQDIKLELNNGTLTLKAGSKVYVPNGFEEDGTTPYFDEVITTNDLTLSETQNVLREKFVFISQDGTQMRTMDVSNTYSGETAPSGSTYMCWYDTRNNLVKTTSNGGSSWTTLSLPIAISHIYSSGFTSIDQVFNGFGYIGSIIFALPNVKGLCPQGLNDDGTLNNIEFTIPSVSTSPADSGSDIMYVGYRPETGVIDIMYPPNWEFDFKQNKWIHKTIGFNRICKVAEFTRTTTSGQNVSAFNPKSVMNIVDSNSSRVVVNTYKSGNDWYRIWSDGWKEQGGELTGTIANTLTHTFLVPFTQRPTVLHTQITVYGNCGYIYRISALELTHISFANYTGYSTTGNGKSGHIGWYACGY